MHHTRNPEDDIFILSTSFVPNNIEANSIRSRLTYRVAEISAIKEAIQTGETSSALWSRQESLIRINNVAMALLAPIRKLPLELLGEIFTHTIPTLSVERALKPSPNPFGENGLYPHHMRFVLRQVCRLWSAVTYCTPRLWSVLAVDDYYHLSDFENGIKYSKACLLDIFIGRFGWRASAIPARLRSEVGRIRQLILPSPHDDIARLFPVVKCEVAHSLEVLAWSWDDYDAFSPLEMGVVNINAPKLQFVALVDTPLSLKSFPASSIRGLRRLHLLTPSTESLSSGNYLSLLLLCPSLEELEIHHISGVWEAVEDNGTTRVSLLSLRSLAISHSHDDDTILFLQDLYAPKLEELSLSLNTFPQYDDEGRWPIDQGLRALFDDARASLQKIKLEHLCLLGDDDVSLMSSLINLRTLEIKQCIIGNAVLGDLTPKSVSCATWPCPQLSSLTFNDVKLAGEELVRIVRKRTCSDSNMGDQMNATVITIKNFHGLEDDHEDELMMLAYYRSRTLQLHPLMTDSFSSSDASSDVSYE